MLDFYSNFIIESVDQIRGYKHLYSMEHSKQLTWHNSPFGWVFFNVSQ